MSEYLEYWRDRVASFGNAHQVMRTPEGILVTTHCPRDCAECSLLIEIMAGAP